MSTRNFILLVLVILAASACVLFYKKCEQLELEIQSLGIHIDTIESVLIDLDGTRNEQTTRNNAVN